RVRPYTRQPATSGTEAMKRPSASRSIVTTYRSFVPPERLVRTVGTIRDRLKTRQARFTALVRKIVRKQAPRPVRRLAAPTTSARAALFVPFGSARRHGCSSCSGLPRRASNRDPSCRPRPGSGPRWSPAVPLGFLPPRKPPGSAGLPRRRFRCPGCFSGTTPPAILTAGQLPEPAEPIHHPHLRRRPALRLEEARTRDDDHHGARPARRDAAPVRVVQELQPARRVLGRRARARVHDDRRLLALELVDRADALDPRVANPPPPRGALRL